LRKKAIVMDAKALNDALAGASYVSGFMPSQADVAQFDSMSGAPDAKAHPHAARWYSHIASFSLGKRLRLPGAAAAGGASAAPKAAKKADAELDLWGDGGDEEEESYEDMMARKKKEAEEKKEKDNKKKKKAVIAKSTVVFSIKPACFDGDDDDDESGGTIDLNDMRDAVKGITMDGLKWGASEFKEIGYGIKKLQIMCTVEDDKVSVDALQETIEEFEDLVQSVEIDAFNKV